MLCKAIQLAKLDPLESGWFWYEMDLNISWFLNTTTVIKKTNNNSKCNKIQNDHQILQQKPTKWCNSTSKSYQTKKKMKCKMTIRITWLRQLWDIEIFGATKRRFFLIVTEEYVMFIWQLLHWCAYCNYFLKKWSAFMTVSPAPPAAHPTAFKSF